jgi:hypothetical protein
MKSKNIIHMNNIDNYTDAFLYLLQNKLEIISYDNIIYLKNKDLINNKYITNDSVIENLSIYHSNFNINIKISIGDDEYYHNEYILSCIKYESINIKFNFLDKQYDNDYIIIKYKSYIYKFFRNNIIITDNLIYLFLLNIITNDNEILFIK